MKKNEMMYHWAALKENQPIMPHFRSLPYKSQGSRYGTCGIRIDGTPEFVDAVLSHLKELLAAEGTKTRLACSYNEVKPVMGKGFDNAECNAVCAYIRREDRGDQIVAFEERLEAYRAHKTRKTA